MNARVDRFNDVAYLSLNPVVRKHSMCALRQAHIWTGSARSEHLGLLLKECSVRPEVFKWMNGGLFHPFAPELQWVWIPANTIPDVPDLLTASIPFITIIVRNGNVGQAPRARVLTAPRTIR